jgi:hypothetical protein
MQKWFNMKIITYNIKSLGSILADASSMNDEDVIVLCLVASGAYHFYGQLPAQSFESGPVNLYCALSGTWPP